jgi:peptidoglycan/LPS O-acetylase OafA/YrhL
MTPKIPQEPAPAPATSRFVQNLGGSRLPCLDGLRGIAAYLVVITHMHVWAQEHYAPGNWGAFGVSVFFVISGFLITHLLIGEFERNSAVSLKRFYIRRTLRIFPAFYVYWAITLVLAIALHKKFGRWEPVAAFFYMGDYYQALFNSDNAIMGITWSLGVEEKFYLLWPAVFVALLGQWSKLLKLCLGIVALLWVYKLILLHVVHPPFRHFKYAFDTRVDVILIGCALALATRLRGAQPLFSALARRAWYCLPTLALLIATVVAVPPYDSALVPPYFTYVMPFQILLLPVLFVQLISWSDHPLIGFLSSKPARVLGDLSYGIYLYNYTVFWLTKRFLASRLHSGLLELSELLLPLLAAYVSFRLIERPFLRLKERFSGLPAGDRGRIVPGRDPGGSPPPTPPVPTT